jgi:hypothetical protein
MVVMKCSVFWDITPCSMVKANQSFGVVGIFSSESKVKPRKRPE